MPRGEWDDNSWYDEGDFPPASRNEGRGGMVAAGIFSFLMCAFNAVGAACFLSCSGFCALVAADNQGGMNILPADMVQLYMWGFLGSAPSAESPSSCNSSADSGSSAAEAGREPRPSGSPAVRSSWQPGSSPQPSIRFRTAAATRKSRSGPS